MGENTLKKDVAGSLFTSMHRNVKIKGQPPAAQNLEGTGSCFDATEASEARAGAHLPLQIDSRQLPRWSKALTQYRLATPPPDPQAFLLKGEGERLHTTKIAAARARSCSPGGGGTASPAGTAGAQLSAATRSGSSSPPVRHSLDALSLSGGGGSAVAQPSPPRAGATALRANPPNTAFRKFYERGDLPIAVDHRSFKNCIKWTVELDKLDYHHYLPIFFDGIRETQDPYRFLAIKGVEDLLAAGGSRILPVIPQLIIPIKTALNTRDLAVICRCLQLLQKLVLSADLVGQALVPYFRQIMPMFNLYITRNKNLGDGIDYGQQQYDCLGELCNDTLILMEQHGGPDAFINIRYMIPTYESCVTYAA